MEKEKIYGAVSIIISVIAIIISYNKDNFIITITLAIAAVTFYYLSAYTKRIERNEEETNKLKNKIEADEKLLNTLKDIYIIKKSAGLK